MHASTALLLLLLFSHGSSKADPRTRRLNSTVPTFACLSSLLFTEMTNFLWQAKTKGTNIFPLLVGDQVCTLGLVTILNSMKFLTLFENLFFSLSLFSVSFVV
jgi:hypothetical protein